MGGLSSEREVSLNTGAGVLAALQERGYDAVGIDWKPGTSLPHLLEDAGIAVVWNALHGTYGEDGAVQGLCACLGLPCTGSGILASALAMDKVASKRIFESHGVPTPRWCLLAARGEGPDDGSDGEAALADPAAAAGGGAGHRTQSAAGAAGWPLPLVVKPCSEGSSVGVTIVRERGTIAAAVATARRYHGPVLVEEYIPGTELAVGILDGAVLGSVEIRPAVEFYDYEGKYKRNDTQYLVPPSLPADIVARAEGFALEAYRSLGCSGQARPDLRISPTGEAYVLEVNTLPGMTKTSLLPKIGRAIGIDYATLCERILASAR